jgi:sulfur-oxidizing protein SoxA
MGQMNLACANCHDRNWGRTLLFETISQGHGTGWPAYRLEWQTFGSLQRRLRACYSGLRAEMPEYGARELVELELFLAWRATGLPIESPGVRR